METNVPDHLKTALRYRAMAIALLNHGTGFEHAYAYLILAWYHATLAWNREKRSQKLPTFLKGGAESVPLALLPKSERARYETLVETGTPWVEADASPAPIPDISRDDLARQLDLIEDAIGSIRNRSSEADGAIKLRALRTRALRFLSTKRGAAVFCAVPAILTLALIAGPPRLQRMPASLKAWQVELYEALNFSGTPAVSAFENAVTLPPSDGNLRSRVSSQPVALRWKSCLRVERQGLASYSVTSDKPSRVFIDGLPVLDNWKNFSDQPVTIARVLGAGIHWVTVENISDPTSKNLAFTVTMEGKPLVLTGPTTAAGRAECR